MLPYHHRVRWARAVIALEVARIRHLRWPSVSLTSRELARRLGCLFDFLFDVRENLAIAVATLRIEPGEHGIDVVTTTGEPRLGDAPAVIASLL